MTCERRVQDKPATCLTGQGLICQKQGAVSARVVSMVIYLPEQLEAPAGVDVLDQLIQLGAQGWPAVVGLGQLCDKEDSAGMACEECSHRGGM